ncbi:MAG: T9SS type A sorting domain-containing protein [Chitinivibrionia bacterium]|nr:T9SS type A sorting domain-containing protein [Chitinivibrionia bacterium]
MKKFYVALMAMILAGGMSFAFSQEVFTELVSEELGDSWGAEGEHLDNNPVANYNGTYVEATFVLQAEDEDNDIYPSGSLGYYDDYNYVGLDSIVVEYEADQNIAITLMHYDDDTYYEEAFFKVLNKTTGSKTKAKVLPGDLAVDQWSEFTGSLNLAKIKGVSFAAVEYEKSTTIKLYSVKLYGIGIDDGDDDDDDDNNGGGGGNSDLIELINNSGLGDWYDYADNLGSNVNITSQNPLTATLTLGESDADANDWAYLGLGFSIEGGVNFSRLIKIEIAYTANGALDFVVEDSNDNEVIKESLSSGSNTKTINVTSSQAAGIGNKAGFKFTHENEGETVNLTVTSVKLYFSDNNPNTGGGTNPQNPGGSGGADAISKTNVKANKLAVTGISAGKIGLTVPTTGNYSVGIYSIDGKMLTQTKVNLVQGVNSLTLGKNLAKGIAIVRIQGTNAALVKKISIK